MPEAVLRRRPLLAGAAAAVALITGATSCATASGDPRTKTRPVGPFWVDPNSEAAQQAAVDPAFSSIANQPTALTVTGGLGDPAALIKNAVAQSHDSGQTLILQVYDIPHRDVGGGYSAGGAPSAGAYSTYIRRLAHALTGTRAVVILEPDSLAQMDQLSIADQTVRYALLNEALDVFNAVENVVVYLDGANSGWTPAPEMGRRLGLAGVKRAQGFAVNVSNFYPTPAEAQRAEQISTVTGGAHYVIDTSRNGGTLIQGHHASWCNPPAAASGRPRPPTPPTPTPTPTSGSNIPGRATGTAPPASLPPGSGTPPTPANSSASPAPDPTTPGGRRRLPPLRAAPARRCSDRRKSGPAAAGAPGRRRTCAQPDRTPALSTPRTHSITGRGAPKYSE